MIVGAGENSEQIARAFHAHGVTTMFVANRRRDRAIALAARFGGASGAFDALPAELERADVVVLHRFAARDHRRRGARGVWRRAAGGRCCSRPGGAARHRSRLRAVDGVTLLDMDALQRAVRGNLSVREAEAVRAEAIVEDEIQTFAGWLGRLEVLPTLTALRSRGDAVVEELLAANAGRWESLSERDEARVEALARAVVKRLLHEPTERVRELDAEHRHARLAAPARAVRPRRGRGVGGRTRPPRSAGWPGDKLRLGTRGSALALAQARSVAALIDGEVELVKITTAGDVDRARGDKSRWVGALEAALLAGEIDVAVHSPRTCRRSSRRGRRSWPRRAARTRSTCRRRPARGRAGGHERAAPALAAAGLAAGPGGRRDPRERGHAAGQARGGRGRRAGAGGGRARAPGPRDEVGSKLVDGVFVPAAGQGVIAVQGREGDGSCRGRRPRLDPCGAGRRALRRAGARRRPATRRSACSSLEGRMRAFVGMPDGSEWIVEEAATARGARTAPARRGRGRDPARRCRHDRLPRGRRPGRPGPDDGARARADRRAPT